MTRKLDLRGKRFGRLTVIKELPKRGDSPVVRWLCRCDCGESKDVGRVSLMQGGTKSCGCIRKEVIAERSFKHGLCKHHLYIVHKNMMSRCNYKGDKDYPNYGGRGIKVCKEWVEDFINFYKDMEGSYQKGLTLDRIDNELGYFKDNCRWATPKQQARNRRKRCT